MTGISVRSITNVCLILFGHLFNGFLGRNLRE